MAIPKIERYGSGHINETYLVDCPEGPKYILQKINTNIFKNYFFFISDFIQSPQGKNAVSPSFMSVFWSMFQFLLLFLWQKP